MKKKATCKVECAFDKMVDTAALIPNPRNPNKHPQKQLDLLAKIIKAQGWRNAIVVSNLSGFVTKGHARLDAAKILGCEQVPVDFQDYDTPESEMADMLADNRLSELAEPDLPMLKDILLELDTGAFDMDLTGFDTESIESLMTQLHEPEEGLTEDDAIPENVETRCKKGDLWKLGEHRLLCGDSTVITDVERLMGGEKAELIATDPPYNSTNLKFDSVKIDYLAWISECKGWLTQFGQLVTFADFHLLVKFCEGNVFKSCYEQIWQKNQTMGFLSVDKRPLKVHEFIGVFSDYPSKTTYNPQKFNFESSRFKIGEVNPAGRIGKTAHYGKQVSSRAYIEDGERYPLSVVFCQSWNGGMALKRAAGENGHPTQKPIALVEYLIQTYSNEKELILDPFLGSGSTLIACEKLGRKCYGMEIDPHYCSVILKRGEDFTGKPAELIKE